MSSRHEEEDSMTSFGDLANDPMKAITELAEALAKQRIDSAFHAWQVVTAEILSVMVEKDLLTMDELVARLDKLDAGAARHKKTAPMNAEFTTQATMALRNAFGLGPQSKN